MSRQEVSWCHELSQLVKSNVITGFALLTTSGVAAPCIGKELQKELSLGEQGGDLPLRAQIFLAPFNTHECNLETLPFLGQQLLVVRQGPEAIYAVGKRRQLNCGVLCLPHGVLLATWSRATPAQSAVTALEAAAHRLRRL